MADASQLLRPVTRQHMVQQTDVACVVLKSAVMSHYFLFFSFFFAFSSGPGKEVKGQLAQHQSHQSASVTNYY